MDSEAICDPKKLSLTDSLNNIGLRDASASKKRIMKTERLFQPHFKVLQTICVLCVSKTFGGLG